MSELLYHDNENLFPSLPNSAQVDTFGKNSTPTKETARWEANADSGVKSGKLSDHFLNEPAGLPTGHEAKLLARLKELQSGASNVSDYRLSFNGNNLIGLPNLDFLRTPESELSIDEMRKVLFGKQYPDVSSDCPFPATDFTRLIGCGETAFQASEHFQETFIKSFYTQAVDLHTTGRKLYPMTSTTNEMGEGVINSSAKPDVASLVIALILELKSDELEGPLAAADFEVILQGIDRLIALIQVKGYLSRCFAIVVSPRSAHVLQLRRREELLPGASAIDKYLGIDIVRINLTDVSHAWCLLTNIGIAHPEAFLSRDGQALEMALKAHDIQLQNCRVSLVRYSPACAVYFVTRCDEKGVFPLNAPDLAVKINRRMESFDLETKAHCRIAHEYVKQGKHSGYYIRGLFDSRTGSRSDLFPALTPCPAPDLPDRVQLIPPGLWQEEALSKLSAAGADVASTRLLEIAKQPSWLKNARVPAHPLVRC